MVVLPCPIPETSEGLGHFVVKKNWDSVFHEANQVSGTRFLATAQKESGAWLNALPVSSLVKLLDSESFNAATNLRVGADVCIPHSFRCSWRMGNWGTRVLSCKYSARRFLRHSTMNDVIKRALQKAGLPSVLEPPGLDRGDE